MAHRDIQSCIGWFQRIGFFSLGEPSSFPQFCAAFSRYSWSTRYWYRSAWAIAGPSPVASSSRYAWSRNSLSLYCQPQPRPCPSARATSSFYRDKWSTWTRSQHSCWAQTRTHSNTQWHWRSAVHSWYWASSKTKSRIEVSPRCQTSGRSSGILSCRFRTWCSPRTELENGTRRRWRLGRSSFFGNRRRKRRKLAGFVCSGLGHACISFWGCRALWQLCRRIGLLVSWSEWKKSCWERTKCSALSRNKQLSWRQNPCRDRTNWAESRRFHTQPGHKWPPTQWNITV